MKEIVLETIENSLEYDYSNIIRKEGESIVVELDDGTNAMVSAQRLSKLKNMEKLEEYIEKILNTSFVAEVQDNIVCFYNAEKIKVSIEKA